MSRAGPSAYAESVPPWRPWPRRPVATLEAARHGPWPAFAVAQIDVDELAAEMGQDPDHVLMMFYADRLRELGEVVLREHDGSFLALARSGDGSAVALAHQLATMPGFHDISTSDGEPVQFFRRVQITAADLHGQGIAPATDLHRLTVSADSLVAHVLRVDGVLDFDNALIERIEREELIRHGCAEEVEIRACANLAVELLVTAHGNTTAATVDRALRARGAGPSYGPSGDTARAAPPTETPPDRVRSDPRHGTKARADGLGRGQLGFRRRSPTRAGRPSPRPPRPGRPRRSGRLR